MLVQGKKETHKRNKRVGIGNACNDFQMKYEIDIHCWKTKFAEMKKCVICFAGSLMETKIE